MPKGFFTLLMAQFCSSWADNALLIVAIAIMMAQGEPAWAVPMLKFLFTLSYVLLAPWVGVFADVWPKTHIMIGSHFLKLMGVGFMMSGSDVLWSYALVGAGAALYSPAKYGWITQMVQSRNLVRANGWIETSTVCAAMGGVACGGWWSSSGLSGAMASQIGLWGWIVHPAIAALIPVACIYALTVLLTHQVPSAPIQLGERFTIIGRSVDFFRLDWNFLLTDTRARMSLYITTLFWGVGACMQLLVLSWAQTRLGLTLDYGAYLQGLAGLGVMLGAWYAGSRVPLQYHHRVLPCGILLGLLLPTMDLIHDVTWAWPLTLVVGVLSGLLIVPMNAMLQFRGKKVLTSGRSIAVQNFNENLSILIMLGLYAGLVQAGVSFMALLSVFSLLILIPTFYFMAIEPDEQPGPDPSTDDLQS